MNGLQATEMREAVRDGIVRSLAVVGLVGIALSICSISRARSRTRRTSAGCTWH